MLSHLHRKSLAEILGSELLVHELPCPKRETKTALNALAGHIDGVSPDTEHSIVARIGTDGASSVYLDGSNLGRLARTIKRAHPRVTVISFFHNVEARFFLGALRRRPGLRPAAVLLANYRAERLAARFSDRRVALNARDSRLLDRWYGRSATDILPMALADQLDPKSAKGSGTEPGYALFVGGAFYANQAGIVWFADKVAPHIPMRTVVVGQGMEQLRARLERSGRIDVVGAVPRLQDWYRDASVAIAPIFDGSGMKTKVAEALMFGKRPIGTSEALTGYEAIEGAAGPPCDSREAFIQRLQATAAQPPPTFDPALRRIYEEHYSPEALKGGLTRILASVSHR